MREIEHNAPGFQYKVYWKEDGPQKRWNIEEITDWKTDRVVIEGQPTYQQYRIKVVAHNDLGKSELFIYNFDAEIFATLR